jgi:hypothetical protein
VKKGFTRTLEAVIAIVLISGVLSWSTAAVAESSKNPTQSYGEEEMLNVAEETGILPMLLERYDFEAIDSFFYYMLPASASHKIEFEKYVGMKIAEGSGQNVTKIIGFTYNFAPGTKEDSVNIFSEGYSYEHNVLWGWYKIPITIVGTSQDISNEVIHIKNITITADMPIWNNSLLVYQGQNILEIENPFEHNEYSGNETQRTINLTININKINAYELAEITLFYADNRTIWNSTDNFAELGTPIEMESTYSNSRKADRADVLVNLTLEGGKESTVYMSYGINGGNSIYQTELTQVNNTNVTVTMEENDVKEGSKPLFKSAPSTNTNVANKILLTSVGLFRISFYTWYT